MRYATLALVLGVVLWLAFRPSAVERPNVLLVTMDTLRPDAVGPGTPAMEAFLAGATRFTRTRTVAPLTLPAHASILSGLEPATHGIHDNVTEPLPAARPFPLLAEQFKDAGYATAAFASCGVLGPASGIAKGFDVYECPEGLGQQEGDSIAGEERVKAAITYLEGVRGKPWFVWVHIFDAHAPYEVFAGDARRAATQEGDPAHALYLGDVRRADAALEKLLAAAGEKTIVVLASDHGESFGEHGERSHGPLCYGATVDTLLAVRAPGFAPGASDAGLRSVTDIAPTLRGLCGLTEVVSDGRDLAGAPHETVVSESLFTWRIHGWGQCFSVTDGEYTLVESGPGVELFDRRKDPGEVHPLPLSLRAYEKLDRVLERFRARRSPEHEGGLLTSLPAYGQTRRDVKGYLPRHENASLADPRPHLAAWMAVQEIPWVVRMAVERRESAPLEAALRMLADFGREAGKSPLVPFHRARVCEAMAEVTGEPSWLEVAAAAQLEAVQKGYTGRDQIRQAITCAVAAGDDVVLRSLTAFLRAGGRKLDADLERDLAEASRAIGQQAVERRLATRPAGSG